MPPSPQQPVGIFDSGIGGLTVLDAIRQILPHEDYIYLGDTARCEEDVLSYIAFPQVAEDFFKKRSELEEKKVRYTISKI